MSGRKYVNFLGIPMLVASDEEIIAESETGTPMLYGVARVADTDPRSASPALRARRRKVACERCEHMCWLDPLGYEPTQGKADIICTRCLPTVYAELEAAHKKDNQ